MYVSIVCAYVLVTTYSEGDIDFRLPQNPQETGSC